MFSLFETIYIQNEKVLIEFTLNNNIITIGFHFNDVSYKFTYR